MPDIAVLIPTYLRAEKIGPLAENIAAVTETPHRIYFIAEYGDEPTRDALETVDAVSVFGDFGSCARAMNMGYQASTEPFLHTGNDDLEYQEGWDIAALTALEDETKHICGTNDSHGRMTCFAFVRRSYIEQHSGVFDKPNTLYHEYASQYVDTEFADYARARGVWTEARDSVTKHLHHDFGDADPGHPNYEKARAHLEADHALYRERKPQWEAAAR